VESFTKLTATACPIDQLNLNTDQILPARYLKWTRSQALGTVLFHDLRLDDQRNERDDFPLNKAEWRDAKIIIGERNFGCGSSREAAVYALYDYGIRCLIAPSFGDIFAGNAVQNGLLAATVAENDAAEIADLLKRTPDAPVTVDLEAQTIACGQRTYRFIIDALRRRRLLNGWDDIVLTESYGEHISDFKAQDKIKRPWAVPQDPS